MVSGLQPYTLRKPGADEDDGVVIISMPSGVALPIPRNDFESVEDAERFLQWVGESHRSRLYRSIEAEALASEWHRVRELECPTCGDYLGMSVRRFRSAWMCSCECDPEAAGNGGTAVQAIVDWRARAKPAADSREASK